MAQAGIPQRLADDGMDRQDVLAAGDFEEDAAKTTVQLDLRSDDVAEDAATVLDDGGAVSSQLVSIARIFVIRQGSLGIACPDEHAERRRKPQQRDQLVGAVVEQQG